MDTTWGTYISEYVLAGVTMSMAVAVHFLVPVPGKVTWLQSTGRLFIEAGWRSPQQKAWLQTHWAGLSVGSFLSALSRFISSAERIDQPDTPIGKIVWRLALACFSVSSFALARFIIWSFFSRRPPRPSSFTSLILLSGAYYATHFVVSQMFKFDFWVLWGYVPAWALVFIFGLTMFITLRKPACLAALVASLLYLVAALLTQPPTNNLLMTLNLDRYLKPQFNSSAVFNCAHIACELLLCGAGVWMVLNGMLHGEVMSEMVVPRSHMRDEDLVEGNLLLGFRSGSGSHVDKGGGRQGRGSQGGQEEEEDEKEDAEPAGPGAGRMGASRVLAALAQRRANRGGGEAGNELSAD